MPVKKCTKDGVSGYKYGDEGHCYTGKGARAKAAQQGRAIEVSKRSDAISKLLAALEKVLGNIEENARKL